MRDEARNEMRNEGAEGFAREGRQPRGRNPRRERAPRSEQGPADEAHSAPEAAAFVPNPVSFVSPVSSVSQDAGATAVEGNAVQAYEGQALEPRGDNSAPRERRSRDRYGRDRGNRGERSRGPRNGSPSSEFTPNEAWAPADNGPAASSNLVDSVVDGVVQSASPDSAGYAQHAAEPAQAAVVSVVVAPTVAPAVAPTGAVASVVAPIAEAAPVAAPAAARPAATSYALPTQSLEQLAAQSGLQWVNTDAKRVAAVQAAIAAEAPATHVPRARPAPVAVDNGPLVLVETKRDLGSISLPAQDKDQPAA